MTRNPTHVPETLSTPQTTSALGLPHPGTKGRLHHSKIEHGPGEPQCPCMRKSGLLGYGAAGRHLRSDEASGVGTEKALAGLATREHFVALRVARRDDRGEAAQLRA